jgi:hypothetical protein
MNPARPTSRLHWIAWALLSLAFLVIATDVVRHPASHTTTPTYRLASVQWWAGHDPYTTNAHAGFLYFPQAAILFTPFTWGPLLLGEILWRLVTFGLFVFALVRLADFFLARDGVVEGKDFLILSLLAVPASLASLRNAQFDLPLAALIVLASAEIARTRWNSATVWLCLALALKPLAVVPMLLFSALYWKLIPRVMIGVLIVVALPFLHWSPAFAAHEYVRCFQTLVWAAKADEARYSDLAALLSRFGYNAPDLLKTVVRILCSLLYLGLAATGLRRLGRSEAAWLVGALSADYLMLFNPRTETCSYVFLSAFVASLAIIYARQSGRKWLSWLLGIAAVGLACDAIPGLFLLTDRWFKPLIALFFLPVLIQFIFRVRPAADPPERNLSEPSVV